MGRFHKPALLKEVIEYLNIKPGEKYIDATVGGGGHTEAILKRGGKVLGIDCDPEAIKAARRYLSQACPVPKFRDVGVSWCLVRENFAHLKEVAEEKGFAQVAGIFFDLGVSSYQLETPERGFSFEAETFLDMRMDPSLKVTAADLINGLNKGELDELFSKLAQEKYSRRLAGAICRARRIAPIRTCRQLTEIVVKVKPRKKGGRHPATNCFLALRIAVNDELNNLKRALPQALALLKIKGRLVIISFHSGEDRIVKNFLKKNKDRLKILTKKPVRPTEREIKANPRSRSAKLRAGEKIK